MHEALDSIPAFCKLGIVLQKSLIPALRIGRQKNQKFEVIHSKMVSFKTGWGARKTVRKKEREGWERKEEKDVTINKCIVSQGSAKGTNGSFPWSTVRTSEKQIPW